jgi:dsDNA-specific endonuclease/ATPase MutS2
MQSLITLEYGKLLALVARHAQTPMGKSRLENLQPLIGRLELEKDLRAVAETFELGEKQVSWRFFELADPSDAIAVLKIKNATLYPTTLIEITRLCNQALFARSVISPEKDFAPTLWQTVEKIPKALFDVLGKINIEGGKAYTRTTAALRIARKLSGYWSWFYGFTVVPSLIRDVFYNLFAKYRYKMFGKQEACMLPTPEIRARFLATN